MLVNQAKGKRTSGKERHQKLIKAMRAAGKKGKPHTSIIEREPKSMRKGDKFRGKAYLHEHGLSVPVLSVAGHAAGEVHQVVEDLHGVGGGGVDLEPKTC